MTEADIQAVTHPTELLAGGAGGVPGLLCSPQLGG